MSEAVPLYAFNTSDRHEATAALLLYVAYRSRSKRFKISLDMWSRIERFARVEALRTSTLPAYFDALKRRLECDGVGRRALTLALYGPDAVLNGAEPPPLDWLTTLFRAAEPVAVFRVLRRETGLVVLLVRDRLERERAHEKSIETLVSEEAPEVVEAVWTP